MEKEEEDQHSAPTIPKPLTSSSSDSEDSAEKESVLELGDLKEPVQMISHQMGASII